MAGLASSREYALMSIELIPMPTILIPEDEVEYILEMTDRGYPAEFIANEMVKNDKANRKQGKVGRKATYLNRIERVLKQREYWCPIRSPKSMEMAYLGDADAFAELTFYERDEVLSRVYSEHYVKNRPHPTFTELEHVESVGQWAKSVGLNIGYFQKKAMKYEGTDRMYSKFRVKMTLEKARELRRLRAETDLTIADLTRRFGIGYHAVYDILNNRRWREPET
jgi:hypothetical protein